MRAECPLKKPNKQKKKKPPQPTSLPSKTPPTPKKHAPKSKT